MKKPDFSYQKKLEEWALIIKENKEKRLVQTIPKAIVRK